MPQVDSLWKHVKGTVYKVLLVSTDEETHAVLVSYQLPDGSGTVWTRKLEVFLARFTPNT